MGGLGALVSFEFLRTKSSSDSGDVVGSVGVLVVYALFCAGEERSCVHVGGHGQQRVNGDTEEGVVGRHDCGGAVG